MIDVTNKIKSIPTDILKLNNTSVEELLEKQQRENAALSLCGGLLGNCYIMMEIVGWMLEPCGLNILNRIKQQSWYKQEVKKEINNALTHLYRNIQSSKENSLTNEDYMQSVADTAYEELKPDIQKLSNSIHMLLGKYPIKADINVISDFITIEILLQWISLYYDDIIKQCKEIYPAYYETWYYNARNTGASQHWSKAVSIFGNKTIKDQIDLNTEMIHLGVRAIDNKMRSYELTTKVREEALKWSEEGKGLEEYNEALDILCLTEKAKHKQALKDAKKEYRKSQSKELSEEKTSTIFRKAAHIITTTSTEEEALKKIESLFDN